MNERNDKFIAVQLASFLAFSCMLMQAILSTQAEDVLFAFTVAMPRRDLGGQGG